MQPLSTQRGTLFLFGGAEDKKRDKRLLKELLDETQADRIAVIPTASDYPDDILNSYREAFSGLGASVVRGLDVRYREDAQREENLAAIAESDLVYFGGGDQVKLVRILAGTPLFDQICRQFESGSLHIAGTSAGAAAAGDPMIYNGDRRGFKKGSIESTAGFGWIRNIAIDTHFLARRRLPRLAQFLLSGKCDKGIGLDEDTGIMVFANLRFKVLGSGMVTVLNSRQVTGSNYHQIRNGEKLAFNNMRIGFLPAGTLFSLKRWSILQRA